MAEYKCGDCIHADVCEEAETLIGFSRDNPAYCGMFLNAADVAPVRHGYWRPILHKDGKTDEDHLRAACWNLLWALEQRTTHPDLNDMPWEK